MKRYPAEEIYYDMDLDTCRGYDRLTSLVALALSKVPKRIVNKVIKECNIVMLEDGCDGVFFQGMKKKTIFLTDRIWEMKPRDRYHLILHEVAHHHLNHKELCGSNAMQEHTKQEADADALAGKWNKNRAKIKGRWL